MVNKTPGEPVHVRTAVPARRHLFPVACRIAFRIMPGYYFEREAKNSLDIPSKGTIFNLISMKRIRPKR